MQCRFTDHPGAVEHQKRQIQLVIQSPTPRLDHIPFGDPVLDKEAFLFGNLSKEPMEPRAVSFVERPNDNGSPVSEREREGKFLNCIFE
jgi:hypothetical protein